eukprot:2798655-Pyramimonas_sp.AAC.1
MIEQVCSPGVSQNFGARPAQFIPWDEFPSPLYKFVPPSPCLVPRLRRSPQVIQGMRPGRNRPRGGDWALGAARDLEADAQAGEDVVGNPGGGGEAEGDPQLGPKRPLLHGVWKGVVGW